MFTGLVEGQGKIRELRDEPPGKRLVIDPGPLAGPLDLGASVSINGCCLTLVGGQEDLWEFSAGPETLSRTNLGRLQVGSLVNLERSLRVGDSLGGHFVTGHIDATGQVLSRQNLADWSTIWFSIPAAFASQLAPKGSIAIDGVSLTLVEVDADRFSVQLIPHTLAVTTLGAYRVGDAVNLETDVLAKYVAAQLAHLGKTSHG